MITGRDFRSNSVDRLTWNPDIIFAASIEIPRDAIAAREYKSQLIVSHCKGGVRRFRAAKFTTALLVGFSLGFCLNLSTGCCVTLVLECILSPKCARKQPVKLLGVSFIFFSAGVLVYLAIPGLNGTPLIFTLLPFLPLVFRLLIWEEKEEEAGLRRHETGFFDYHNVLLQSYAYIFLGAIIASVFWYCLLIQFSPDTAHNAFDNEISEISAIAYAVNQTGAATANAIRPDFFSLLFGHNMQVLALMLLFSLLYGVGSLYLLLWNASVIGVFIATAICAAGPIVDASSMLNVFFSALNAFFGLLPHGIFELSAYFVASIAGGVFSVAIMRRHLERPELKSVLFDSFVLVLIAIALLFVGALVESSY